MYEIILPPAFPPTSPQASIEEMFSSACRVCDNILDFHPDLVLCLMHSGRGPVFAAQTLWQHTQSLPFPPVAYTNLGREKTDLFSKTHRLLMGGPFVGQYTSEIDLGYFLAWLTTRQDWHAQLRRQVEGALHTSDPPERILVVDDTVHEGSTAILTQGLLQIVYPHTIDRFLNAKSWFRSEYGDLLLELVKPGARSYPEKRIWSEEFFTHLDHVATGTENVAEDSLDWQPLSMDSPEVQALSDYHPPEVWLRGSLAVYETIAAHIVERAAAYSPAEPDPKDYHFRLYPDWLMMRDMWLEIGITRRQAEQRYNLSREKVQGFLDDWMNDDLIMLEGHGRGARYIIPPALRDEPNRTEDDDPPDDVEAYWLLPGRFLIGTRNWSSDNPQYTKAVQKDLRQLVEWGVDCLLDVKIMEETEVFLDVQIFQDEAKAAGRTVLARGLPFIKTHKKGKHPNRKDIRPILDLIDHYLACGHVVCVRAERYLRAILAGCYLARHGQAGASALRALQAARATGVDGWKREPPDRKSRRYIRSWPAGL